MPTGITPAAVWTALIPTPDDAEGATGAGLDGFAQALANREEYLKALVETTGVKIVRSVASLAALKALTGMAHREIVLMDDATLGFHLFAYHSTATNTPDDVLIVQPTVGGGRWFTALLSGIGVPNGLAIYNGSGKLGLGKVVNQTYEAAVGILGSNYNNTTTTYATGHSVTSGVTVATGDKVIIHAHGSLSATALAGACSSRLTVSENGGADIALTETEDLFDNSVIHRRSYHTVRTVVTGGSFQVRWQIKSGSSGNAATLATPTAITIQVIRP